MAKSNFGGSGLHHSASRWFTEKKRVVDNQRQLKSFYSSSGDRVLTANEVDEYFSNRLIECLDCGNWFKGLSNHIGRHDLTAREYKEKHGIPADRGLVCAKTSEIISANTSMTIEKRKKHGAIDLICPDCDIVHKGSPLNNTTSVKCQSCRRKSNSDATNRCNEKNAKPATCSFCNDDFMAKGGTLKRFIEGGKAYCSIKCKNRSESEKRKGVKFVTHNKVCDGCNKEFIADRAHRKYCSVKCSLSDISVDDLRNRGSLGGKKRAKGKRDKSGKFIKDGSKV